MRNHHRSRALLHLIIVAMATSNAASFQVPLSDLTFASSRSRPILGANKSQISITSSSSVARRARLDSRLFMAEEKDDENSTPSSFFERKPFFINKELISDKEQEQEEGSDFATTTMVKDPPPAVSPEISKALEEARALKERAEKERLEAERMSTTLLLDKVANLELQLEKLQKNKSRISTSTGGDDDGDLDEEQKSNEKKAMEVKAQISNLKRQLNGESPEPPKPLVKTTASISSDSTTPNNKEDGQDMPKDLYDKRVGAYKSFSPVVKSLFARATLVSDKDDVDAIIRKAYTVEQAKKRDGNTAPMDLLDLANAQAGYETLPPAIQSMVAELVGLEQTTNATVVVEKLIEEERVKRTEDGGVEFSMNDDPDKKEDRGADREFTMAEIENAKSLYEGLPAPMKLMLAQSVGVSNEANTTAVVEKMIQEKKLLPAEDGVEFVVFGNSDQGSLDLGDVESAAYIKSVLPSIVTREENSPAKEDVDIFFSQVLGRKTFNPTNKPEKIPGGYIIRGENKLESGEALVAAIEKSMEKTSIAGKLNFYYMKDPSPATQEEFESDLFELPVLVVSGTDLFPTTNRFVKPGVTALGGLSIASFAVAVCLATDLNMNLDLMEDLTGPIVFAIISTQIAHEMAHQIVGLKDKFKVGAPTIVPSLQLGLQGCITPINSPPPSFNSLFDFAISGPLVGMLISLVLMYSGLEQQVFMDAASQASLPSLPVDLVRCSSLAGGMVEWLLGDGTLVSTGPDSLIRLHPFAIAGFVGILSNALNLLPVGNTDGGRVATSVFGRSFAKFVRGLTLIFLVGAGFFGGDQANVLLFFAIFAQIFQRESVIPCKNEVDGVDDFRAIIAFATVFLVGLAVIPLPI